MRDIPFLNLPFLIVSLCSLFLFTSSAEAEVHIHIDLSTQSMHVDSDGGSYTWAISSARAGYVTPRGNFKPQSLQRMHYSKKYHMSPMPYSIFFAGGYAIHGTYETRWLGHPASHGCVRLSPQHAAILYQLVKTEGAKITITGSPPHRAYYASRARRLHRVRSAATVPATRPFFFAPFGRDEERPVAAGGWQSDPF